MLQHDRRRLVHFNVTAHPTVEWTARQIMEAFPFECAPKYLLRDRDRIYGDAFLMRGGMTRFTFDQAVRSCSGLVA